MNMYINIYVYICHLYIVVSHIIARYIKHIGYKKAVLRFAGRATEHRRPCRPNSRSLPGRPATGNRRFFGSSPPLFIWFIWGTLMVYIGLIILFI